MNSQQYPEPVMRTLAVASALGIACEVVEHEQDGRTSAEAAAALGVDASAVIKTLVLETDRGWAVAILAGDERLDFRATATQLGCRRVKLASPQRVRELTGYDVGGVPPIGFPDSCPVVLSERVRHAGVVIGSAGSPHHGLRLAAVQLGHLYYIPHVCPLV